MSSHTPQAASSSSFDSRRNSIIKGNLEGGEGKYTCINLENLMGSSVVPACTA